MPALVKSSVGSPAGTSDALGTTRWPRSEKKRRKVARISRLDGVTTFSQLLGVSGGFSLTESRSRAWSETACGDGRLAPALAAAHPARHDGKRGRTSSRGAA